MRSLPHTAIKATLRANSVCVNVRVCVCVTCLSLSLPLSLPGSFPYSGWEETLYDLKHPLKSSAVSMWHTYATLIVLTHVRVYECMRVCKYCVYLCVRPTPAKPGLASRVCANPRAVACQRFKRNFRAAVVVRLLSLPLALSLYLSHSLCFIWFCKCCAILFASFFSEGNCLQVPRHLCRPFCC